MMSKKHFQMFASSIERMTNTDDAEHMARVCVEIFKADNSRFDSARFFKACGLNENGQKPDSTGRINAEKIGD